MASISYTTGWHLLYKVGLIAGSLGALGTISPIAETPLRLLLSWMPWWLELFFAIAIFLAAIIGTSIVLIKTVWPPWLPAWCYVRFQLGTPISISEAKLVGFLFNGSLDGGRWYPLNGFARLEKDLRRESIFRFANYVARSHGWSPPFPQLAAAESASQRQQYTQRKSEKQASQPSSLPPQVVEALRLLGLAAVPEHFQTIRIAYRKRISEHHPDKFAGEPPEVIAYANQMTARINLAYSLLEEHLGSASAVG